MVFFYAKKRQLNNQIRIIAFTNHNERSTIMQMLQHVANGYILKNASAQEIVICINEAMEGYVALSKEVKEIMYKPTLDDLKPIPVLTKREEDILKELQMDKLQT